MIYYIVTLIMLALYTTKLYSIVKLVQHFLARWMLFVV